MFSARYFEEVPENNFTSCILTEKSKAKLILLQANSETIMQRIPGLYIAKLKNKGRGVFTAEAISKGSIIEICPIIKIPAHEVDIIHETDLHDYYFVWGEHEEEGAIALGYGSLYNHSYKPKAEYIYDLDENVIEIIALKNIKAGKEITCNYHGDPDCMDELWFDKKGKRIKRLKAKK